jgi:hypothetical protein
MVRLPLLSFGLLLAALASAAASAETRVYRCEERGQVTYTDVPCPKAQVLSLDSGSAAPDARERLRRDQEALDVRAAQRRDALADALAREDAIDRAEAERARTLAAMQPSEAPQSDYYYPAYDAWPWQAQRTSRRDFDRDRDRDRDRERRKDRRSFLPVPTPPHLPSPPPGPPRHR